MSDTCDSITLTKLEQEGRIVDRDEENGISMWYCNLSDNRKYNGIVFDKNGDLVCMSMENMSEFNHTELDRVTQYINISKPQHIYTSHEGVQVRVFNYNGKWYVSTSKRLNAFKSKWACEQSFGDIFEAGVLRHYSSMEEFYVCLNTNYVYVFLVGNIPENRIVCIAPEHPTIYHLGVFKRNGIIIDNIHLDIPKPREHKFKQVMELCQEVGEMNSRFIQGLIVYNPNMGYVKVWNKTYQELYNIRGNEPSIKFRYLQLRMDKYARKALYYLYPQEKDTFNDYENILYDISRNLYRAYVQRFIKKQYVTVPSQEFHILRECHEWYLINRETNRVTPEKIIDVMNKQLPTHLNQMIKRYKTEQVHKKQYIKRTTPKPSIFSPTMNNEENIELQSFSIGSPVKNIEKNKSRITTIYSPKRDGNKTVSILGCK